MLNEREVDNLENKAIIKEMETIKKQNETKIEQNQNVLDGIAELHKQQEINTNNFNVLRNQCVALQDNIKGLNTLYNQMQEYFNNQCNILNNSIDKGITNINNSANSVNQTISKEIERDFTNQVANISKVVISVSGNFKQLQESINKDLTSKKEELIKEMDNEKVSFRRSAHNILGDLYGVLIISAIMLFINTLYNVNYQFHCITWLDTMQVSDLVKNLFLIAVGFILCLILGGIIRSIRDKFSR